MLNHRELDCLSTGTLTLTFPLQSPRGQLLMLREVCCDVERWNAGVSNCSVGRLQIASAVPPLVSHHVPCLPALYWYSTNGSPSKRTVVERVVP